jgi:hypothetical protein
MSPHPPPPPEAVPPSPELVPLRSLKRRWPAIVTAVLTLGMMIGLANELLDHGARGLTSAVPTAPLFYVFFLVSYFALPISDFVVYRRLWGIPASAFGPLNRKRIANDVLLGYTGDAYFYAWARAKLKMVAAPFGAVKDATIVSGIAGNVATILMSIVALPLGWELISPATRSAMLWSLSIPLAVSVLLLAFSRRVFSLPRLELWRIFVIDTVRLVVSNAALGIAWAYAMPSVSMGMWLFLVAARLLVSRLPLVPNKDLLFANFAILVIGQDATLSNLIAFSAASTLLLHVLIIVGFGLVDGVERMKEWRRSSPRTH